MNAVLFSFSLSSSGRSHPAWIE